MQDMYRKIKGEVLDIYKDEEGGYWQACARVKDAYIRELITGRQFDQLQLVLNRRMVEDSHDW